MDNNPQKLLIQNNNMFRIKGEISKKTGRPIANELTYTNANIDGVACVKVTLISKGNPLEFVIDKEDEEKVKSRNWYAASGGTYIASHINIGDSRKQLYLHNFIMNKFTFNGKGQKETVDHINRNGLDNRKCNLRIISQTLQNINQKKKNRTTILPNGIPELPRHIWYIKPTGNHGERFAVEIKSENIIRKTTSSKKVSIQDKFQEALKIRDEIYNKFPYLRS